MGMARVRGFEQQRLRFGHQDDIDDLFERDVLVVRPLVIAPAKMHAQALRRQAVERIIQHLDLFPRTAEERRVVFVLEDGVPAHGEIRAVDLQVEARLDNALILFAHCVAERFQIGSVGRKMLVGLKNRDHAGRGRIHEGTGRCMLADGASKASDVVLERLPILDLDRPGAAGTRQRKSAPFRRSPSFCA